MNSKIETKNLLKFLLGSLVGIMAFLVPIPQGDSFTTSIDFLKNALKSAFGDSLIYIVTAVIIISAVMSIYDYIAKPDFIRNNRYLSKAFVSSPFYLASKVVGLVVAVLVTWDLGPEFITSIDTGATMISLSGTLICIVLSFSFILPFLTDCGIMEFLGVLLKPIVRPLFKVPGRASVDLMASWFGASNAAVILTDEQYKRGFYTKREAAYVMTNFSVVSIPFCLMIADTIGIFYLFPAFYLTICIVGVALAVIMARIPPITKIENIYKEGVTSIIDEEVPDEKNIFKHAVEISCKRAEKFTFNDVISGGLDIVSSVIFDLVPIVVSWGTIALIIATYTPIFDILSYPMGMFLNILGVESAFEVAPATLVGFTDMFIPALLVTSIESVKTKFIIGVLSLVQIIYLTEVGAIIIKSEIPLNFIKLFLIFVQRTIIATPIIVLLANILL